MPRTAKSTSRKSADASPAKPKKATFRKFIRYTATPDNIAEFKRLLRDGVDPIVYIDDVITQGYKVSFSSVSDGQSFNASIYCENPDLENAGLGFSAFAGNAFDAARIALFLHVHVFGDDWLDALEKKNGQDVWFT